MCALFPLISPILLPQPQIELGEIMIELEKPFVDSLDSIRSDSIRVD